MLELHVANTDVTTGSISVGWCVSLETIKILAENGWKNPAIVIVTAPQTKNSGGKNYNSSREKRFVFPMKDLVGYVHFLTAGHNNIWGFIAQDVKTAKDKFLDHNGLHYNTQLLDCNGEEWTYYLKSFLSNPYTTLDHDHEIKTLLTKEPVNVFVPNEVFAPEPAAWEKAWVNHLFPVTKVADQCEFRRRRLFAYTIQPILMGFNWLFRFLALVISSLFAARTWNLDGVLHPLNESFSDAMDVLDLSEGSYCIGQGKDKIRNYATLPFMPILLIAYFLVWKFHAVSGASMVVLSVMSLGAFTGAVVYLIGRFFDHRNKVAEKAPAWYMNQDELPYITCSVDGPKATTVSQLPASKRTIGLRFAELKNKVCKPFSR